MSVYVIMVCLLVLREGYENLRWWVVRTAIAEWSRRLPVRRVGRRQVARAGPGAERRRSGITRIGWSWYRIWATLVSLRCPRTVVPVRGGRHRHHRRRLCASDTRTVRALSRI